MTIDSTTLTQAPVAGPTPEALLPKAGVLRLPRSPKVIAGLVLLAPFAVVAVIGQWISPYSPNATDPQNWVQHVLVPGTGPGTGIAPNYYPLPLPPDSALTVLVATVFAGFTAGAMGGIHAAVARLRRERRAFLAKI